MVAEWTWEGTANSVPVVTLIANSESRQVEIKIADFERRWPYRCVTDAR
jgi:hypothetical protein